MKTEYPFKLPQMAQRLPSLRRDGVAFVDVRVKGKWEGVLVVNAQRECVGIRFNRRTTEWDLPFLPEDIEDFRSASAWNRFFAAIPQSLIFVFPYACLLSLPLLIFSKRYIGVTGPIVAILAGIAGQMIILQRIKAYCITGLPLVIIIFVMEVQALVGIFR